MSRVYIYVVDRDYGFAPNPFHGYCTLATCKPRIRSTARVGDWVIGMGGQNLRATGKCVFIMRVTEKLTFDEYWASPIFLDKKPVRNGSNKMMVGDNIYHHESHSEEWLQANSHHSNADGSVNLHNLKKDTMTDRVLISQHFLYFGSNAPIIPSKLLDQIGYENRRNHRVFDAEDAQHLIDWFENSFHSSFNKVLGDPFDFEHSEKRYSGIGSKVT